MKQDYKEFKPYDRVLVRFGENGVWLACLYSHWDEYCNQHYTLSGLFNDNNILPFEGNEELLGKVGDLKPKRWRAEKDEYYWFIDSYTCVTAKIFKSREDNSYVDNIRYADGNYFQTKEQAQDKLEQIKQIWKNE